jgi:excisionase family DNA binding protein
MREPLMTVGDAGRLLNVSASQVRWLTLQGRLRAIRDSGGRRLYRRQDVERLRDQREAQRSQAAGAGERR